MMQKAKAGEAARQAGAGARILSELVRRVDAGEPIFDRIEREVIEVRLTEQQTETLLAEFSARRDCGTLRYSLGDRVLVGSRETLSEIAYRIDNSATIAEAVSGHAPRAKKLRNILRRIEKAGVTAVVTMNGAVGAERQAGEARVVTAAPEQRLDVAPTKPVHPSTRRKIERRREMTSDDMWDAGIAEWEILRRGRVQGRELGKRAWNAKVEKRAPKAAGMVRGDKVFRRGLPDALPVGKLNDERVEWLRAGQEAEDAKRSRAASRDASVAIARKGASEKIDKRITRMIAVVEGKHGHVRISWVADELIREDVRALRYKSGSGKASYMRRRYYDAAAKRIDPDAPRPVKPIETLSARAQKAAARQAKKRIVRFEKCEHSWRVSPARLKRTCEHCHEVQWKGANGRFRVVERAIVEASEPATHTPAPEPYEMKSRTSRHAARKQRRWIATQ